MTYVSRRRALAASATTSIFTLCFAATAGAAITYETEGDVVVAGESRSIRVDCPRRSEAIGGGIHLFNGSPGSNASTSAPFDGPRGDRTPDDGWAIAGGSAETDFVTGHAVCSDRGRFRYVKSKPKRVDNRSVTARCGKGYRVIGGGVSTTRPSNLIALLQSIPIGAGTKSKNDDGWKGSANNASNVNSKLRVHAICSKTAQVKERTESFLSNGTRFTSELECPSGFSATGGGGTFEGSPNGGYLSSSFPGDPGDADPKGVWSTYANNTTGLTQRLVARALCTKL